jgi:hypothetical protein
MFTFHEKEIWKKTAKRTEAILATNFWKLENRWVT